jgi:hypothetical protein
MKKIIELIKSLLGGGSITKKAVELQQLETEVVAEVKKDVEIVKEKVAEVKSTVEAVKAKVKKPAAKKPAAKTAAPKKKK